MQGFNMESLRLMGVRYDHNLAIGLKRENGNSEACSYS